MGSPGWGPDIPAGVWELGSAVWGAAPCGHLKSIQQSPGAELGRGAGLGCSRDGGGNRDGKGTGMGMAMRTMGTDPGMAIGKGWVWA